MKGINHSIYIIYFLFFLLAVDLNAQNSRTDSLVRAGEELHRQYRFEEAVDIYEQARELIGENPADSALMEDILSRQILSENGLSMSAYAYVPKVISRRKFSKDDFFLYYPLEDRSWRKVPNQLDSISDGLSHALYAPEDADAIYYSAKDDDGLRSIYMTERKDTLWTWPQLLNDYLVSSSDEVYPLLSSDGKSLYFSSRGLYGVGGFDIYVSRWDEDAKDWSEPVNMGFPYSSPYDDFLYMDAAEEGFSFFASDRECASDSIWVYVLEFDNMPVRQPVDDPSELLRISRLDPETKKKEVREEEEKPENMDRYMSKMAQVRALKDSISFYNMSLEDERNRFALSNDSGERMRLSEIIREREARLPQLQDSLSKETSELMDIEMEFLFSGVVLDPDKIMEEASEGHDEIPQYTFAAHSFGPDLELDMIRPEPGFDYTFMILDKGRFAEDNTIPDGIIYQIQIFSTGGKATTGSLRGLSPVFETRSASGRYTYRVGLFKSYQDVNSKLAKVRSLGFRSAFIVAYEDGEEISVAMARNREKSGGVNPVLYNVRIIPPDGELDEAVSAGIRQQLEGKDIARTETEDGTLIYVVGPFTDKSKAEELISFVKAMGLSEVFLEEKEK